MSHFCLLIPGLGELDRQIAKIRALRDAFEGLNAPHSDTESANAYGARPSVGH